MLGWIKPDKEDLFEGNRCKFFARDIVLNQIKPLDGEGISYTSEESVHAVVIGCDELSLYIARQIALVCHYPNFNDAVGKYRTVITIVHPSAANLDDVKALKREFESVTGNLLKEAIWCCKYYYQNGNATEWAEGSKTVSFIDVRFEFVGVDDIKQLHNYIAPDNSNAKVSVIDNSGLNANTSLKNGVYQYYAVPEGVREGKVADFGIDIRRAQMVSMVYEMGTCLNSICVSDMFEVEEYRNLVDILCARATRLAICRKWNKMSTDINGKLSNLFCADCIASKLRSIKNSSWSSYGMLESLARSEHARWNVEKLTLGFRVYTAEESYRYERLFADAAALRRERARLKGEKAHIDLCSCDDLMRIDPSSFKYDCLLVMAAESIAERVKDDK